MALAHEPLIDHEDASRVDRFWQDLAPSVRSARSLEGIAQLFVRRFYEAFGDFAVLVRVFATVRAARLAADDRAFLDDHGLACNDATPVLTLLGTRGVAPAWNDRRTSRNHRLIPLVSQAFIEDAPMIARLFSELGVSPVVEAGADWQYLRKLESDKGLFFVGDARTSTDSHGRPIIPSTEFIEDYGIKTVFGFGGSYDVPDLSVAIVVFCRRTISREFAFPFVRLGDRLRDSYEAGPARGVIFATDEAP